jgi:uncharacterized cupredoxin-like copper-binding protein
MTQMSGVTCWRMVWDEVDPAIPRTVSPPAAATGVELFARRSNQGTLREWESPYIWLVYELQSRRAGSWAKGIRSGWVFIRKGFEWTPRSEPRATPGGEAQHSMRSVWRMATVGGVLTALVLLAWAGPIYASGPPAVVHIAASVNVTITVANTFVFTPSDFEVTPGQNVTITFENLGTYAHTFTLSSVTNWSFNSGNSTSDLISFFSVHHPLLNFIVGTSPGSKNVSSFQAPPYGVYEFVCLEPGHFQSGMFGFMGSGVAVGPAPPPGIPVALFIIVGVIVTLVVIAIVLGFVVGKRQGSKYEMPPERLGYPEPRDPNQNPARPPRPPTGQSPPPGY